MSNQPILKAEGPTVNRIADVMAHTTRYAMQGQTRLAEAVGVHRSTICRIIQGKDVPGALLLGRIASALEADLGFRVDPRDLLTSGDRFYTKYVCDAVGCKACLPDAAYDMHGNLLRAFDGVRPGQWVCSQFPTGFPRKEVHA